MSWIRKLSPRSITALVGAVGLSLVIAHGADRTPAAARQGTELSGPAAATHASRTFRVATFNIHSGVGLDRQADLARTARCLRGFDLVGLNEVRSGGLGGTADQAARLGQQMQQAWLFAPAEHQWWHDHFGNAVLTSLPVRQWEQIPLTGTRGKGFRNLVRFKVDIAGHPVTVLVTHIDRTTDRQAQLQFVIDDFLCQPDPAVLMGDFNSRSDDPLLKRLRAAPGVIDCLTQCSAAVPETIDWIFIRGLECRAAGLRDEGASDHPLAWAELSLPAKPSPLRAKRLARRIEFLRSAEARLRPRRDDPAKLPVRWGRPCLIAARATWHGCSCFWPGSLRFSGPWVSRRLTG